MNILHLQLDGSSGGISILCRELDKISKNNNFFYFLFEGGAISDEMAASGSNVIVKNSRNQSTLKKATDIIKFCKVNKIDVVISHTDSPIVRLLPVLIKLFNKNIKVILYFHCNAVFEMRYTNPIKLKLCKLILSKSFKTADWAVAISNSVKKSYVDELGFDQSKIIRIYNGINNHKFFHNKEYSNKFELIYIGRVYDFKGIDLLIKAFSKSSIKQFAHLSIVGDGEKEYINELKKLTKDNDLENEIAFLGEQTQIENYLSNADFFVHPAICEEGFGLTLIEAFASSVPVIAFNKGAIPEIIDNDANGFIVDDISVNGLKTALEKAYLLFEDKEKYFEMCKNAKIKSCDFLIEKMIYELEGLY